MSATKVHHWGSPSRLGRLAACPGSRALCDGLPEETTPEAESGTRVHAAVAAILRGDDSAFGEARCQDEEADLADACVEWFRTHFPARFSSGDFLVEESLPLTLDGQTIPDYGTADVVVVEPGRRVHVIDWKTGRAEPSERSLALQVAAYALAAMQRFKVHEAEVWIYMPRLDREYRGQHTAGQFLAGTVKVILDRSQAPDARRIPGAEQCAYCPGKPHCPEALAEAQALVPARKEERLPSDPAARGELLRKINYAMDVLETVKARIRDDALEGLTMPEGFRVVTRKATPKIRSAREAFAALKGRIGAGDFLDRCEIKLSALKDVPEATALLEPVIEQAPPIRYLQATTKKEST